MEEKVGCKQGKQRPLSSVTVTEEPCSLLAFLGTLLKTDGQLWLPSAVVCLKHVLRYNCTKEKYQHLKFIYYGTKGGTHSLAYIRQVHYH